MTVSYLYMYLGWYGRTGDDMDIERMCTGDYMGLIHENMNFQSRQQNAFFIKSLMFSLILVHIYMGSKVWLGNLQYITKETHTDRRQICCLFVICWPIRLILYILSILVEFSFSLKLLKWKIQLRAQTHISSKWQFRINQR